MNTEDTYNTYDLSGKYGIGYTLKGEEFYFDLEDYEKIKGYSWFRDGDKYIVYSSWKDRTYFYLHKIIMNATKEEIVDHINRNKVDCRKNNLRKCTEQQNSFNKGIKITNTSGVIGVSWRKDRQKWRAYITFNYEQVFLGYYRNKEEAIKVRLKAEKEYFGDFAPQYHLFKRYGITTKGDFNE